MLLVYRRVSMPSAHTLSANTLPVYHRVWHPLIHSILMPLGYHRIWLTRMPLLYHRVWHPLTQSNTHALSTAYNFSASYLHLRSPLATVLHKPQGCKYTTRHSGSDILNEIIYRRHFSMNRAICNVRILSKYAFLATVSPRTSLMSMNCSQSSVHIFNRSLGVCQLIWIYLSQAFFHEYGNWSTNYRE